MTFWFGCFFENFMRTESISSSSFSQRLHNLDLCTVDPCDGQEIFDHADEPLAVLLNFSQQLELLLLWQCVILGDQRGG